MKLAALCDKDTGIGLRLAGIHTIFTPSNNNLDHLFTTIIQQHDIGLLFITEPLAMKLGKQLKEYRLQNNLPLIVEIPDKQGHLTDHVDFISHLIRRAVGIDITKQ